MKLSVRTRDGYRMLLVGDEGWTGRAAELYLAERCDGVALGALSVSGSDNDVSFLAALPNLRSVVTGAAKVSDPSPVFDCPTIEELSLGPRVGSLVGLGALTGLRHLAVSFRRGVTEVASLDRLVSLSVEEWPKGCDLDVLGMKPELESLWITMKRAAVVTATWFTSAPSLRDVSFYFGRLEQPAGLRACAAVRSLRFADTKVAAIDFVESMPELVELELDNVGEIESFRPLRHHPSLRKIDVTGNSFVSDGELGHLLSIGPLRSVVVEKSRHNYRPAVAEVLAWADRHRR